jgi:WS/DGAT/MGAT family acyltransferase
VGTTSSLRIDRARPDDVLPIAVDHGRVPMAIGALLVLDPVNRPPAPDVRAALVERAATIPRLGQRLAETPVGAGRPVWLDAGADVLAGLVDAAPADGTTRDGPPEPDVSGGTGPGGHRSLLDATADLVLARLPRDRPLWRARLLLDPGDAVSGVALVAHHALADGMGGLSVLAALADGAPSGAGTRAPAAPARGLPPWRELARDAWGERLQSLRAPMTAGRRLGRGVVELDLRRPRLAESCSLLARTSDHRRLDVARVGLQGVRRAAHVRGATVNDLAVTAVTGALVALLSRRGERVAEIVVSMPVSLRRQDSAGVLGNSTGVVPVRVPAVVDADVRLAALVAQEGRVRSSGRGGSAAVLTPVFRGLAALGVFQPFIDHQRLVHTFVTNVRGPAERLRLAGSEVVAVVPVATNPGDVTLSFDVMSYGGTLGITVVSDPSRVAEAPWLARRVEEELTAFVHTAAG